MIMLFAKLKVRLNTASFVMLVIVLIATVYAINHFEKRRAIATAEKTSLILLQHNLAFHSYFNKQLKPKIFALTDGTRDPNFFDPTWMSSTYAVREIDKIYSEDSSHRYYYKEAAINARSPQNEADEFERDFILHMNKDKNWQKLSGIKEFDGKPHFYFLLRGESMEEGCMGCHSTPDKAPGGLVKAYGPARSFNRSVGEVVSAVSIHIPLAEAFSEADNFSLALSTVLFLLLLAVFIVQNNLINRLVLVPLQKIRSQAESIANDTENLGLAIPEIPTQEMNEIVVSFNKMSTRLKAVVDGLDATVIERTAALKENEARYRLLFENMGDAIALHEMIYDAQGNPFDYRFIEVNPAFEKQTGLKAADIVGKTVLEVMPNIEKQWFETYGKVASDGETISFENFSQELGRHYQVCAFSPKPGYFATAFSDITERVMAAKSLQANNTKLEVLLNVSSLPSADVKAVSDHILQSITLITDSSYGFYGFVNEDETIMTIHSWSGEAMQNCTMVDKPSEFAICTAGIWAEAVRRREPLVLNNYADSHPAKIGLPTGHVELSKLLVVPFFSNGKITAVAAVANRFADFSLDDAAQVTAFLTSVQAITESKRIEHELKLSEERYRLLAESVAVIPWEYDILKNSWTYVGPQVTRITGYHPDEWTTLEWWIEHIHPDDRTWVPEYCENLTSRGVDHSMEYRMITKDGRTIWLNDIVTIVMQEDKPVAMRGVLIDVTDHKKVVEERLALEVQLYQVQKMESVGSLAGGVAHDFNNKLSVILGCTYLAFTESDPAKLKELLEEIRKAAEQSADLTRQLLAFARKQTISPKVLDLNETVSGMLKMLNRLIGENINLTWQPAQNLWLLKFDPSQVDQILANLCVNARDSVSKDGKITIETGNSVIDDDFCACHTDALPGNYVRLVVSDNGCGMDNETLNRIFEPFFTTKETGKGTGLGLATVFGVVKQNNGFITVNSQPGSGTTFSIYLPQYSGTSALSEKGPTLTALPGTETILLVEDELAILNMTAMILIKLGYIVLRANTATEAIRLASEHSGEINLLITDVIMPEINGKELAQTLQTQNPQLKCLFMSGYTADIISQHGVIDEEVFFIQKPYSLPDLANKVREVLDDHNQV